MSHTQYSIILFNSQPILMAVQHIEFFHTDHFEDHYHRVKPPAALCGFIDFFWETKFDSLWEQYPEGFLMLYSRILVTPI